MSSFLNSIALYLAVALGLILAGAALISLRNPIIGKLGIRNIPRRPTQSALIVFGLTLSTMIIVSALSLGDTLDNTVRRQTIDAYGQIDQVVSPPFLMDLTQLADGGTIDPDGASSPESAALLNALTGGDINALIAVLDEGLPGITEERKAQLQEDASSYPLIDGVAGSILFPTIIRNVNTGQGEPLGFIFAVDEGYDTGFGLHDIDGEPVRTADLRDGIGDVFVDLVGLWEQSGETAEAIGTAIGLEETSLVRTALALGAAGAVLLQEEGPSFTLRQLELPVEILRNLGFPGEILDEIDSDVISLEGLGITDEELAELNLDPDAPITVPTLPMFGFDVPNQQELIVAATEALSSINLNTLGQDVDETLGQFGLQLRQGEVYLNELGALQLDAQAGDLLEIFIGPIPVPYRVRAVVAEAGPLGAVLPVVMMHTDEAQKLLFMPGKVNNILISNAGDEVSGMVHTAEVSDQLRALSLNEERLAGLLEVLRRPGIAEVVRKESVTPNWLFDDDVPEFIMQIAGMWTQATSFESDIEILVDYVGGPAEGDIPIALRGALSSAAVQEWLRLLPLGNDDRRALEAGMAGLRDFDVLSPLSKQFVTDIAEIGGIALGTVFSSFGILSIFAGVLLIFLIFVMLAAERRSELGIARAVGMRRVHLVQMFVTEGLVYDLAAALVGLGLGLLVSYGMIGFVSGLLNSIVQRVEGASAPIRFYWHAAPSSLIVAYCLGVILTFVVVTVASWNVSRLNIISAIRNLPDTSNGKKLGVIRVSLRGLALIFLLGAGGYLTWLGRDNGQTVAFVGVTLLLVGVGWGGAWLGRRWSSGQAALRLRLAYTFVGVGLFALWGVPWSSVLDTDLPWFNQNTGFTLLSFALSGPFIIIGAIMVVMFNADSLAGLFVRLVGGIGPLTPVLKTAVAYPLSNRFRTGTAMLLFAMVITTVTVMSVVIRATEVVTEPDEQRTAGFDIVLSPGLLSFFDPVTDINEEAAKRPDFPSEQVAVLGTVARMGITARQLEPAAAGVDSVDSTVTVSMTGIDEGYTRQAAQHYGFQMRAAGFNSDEEIWQALAERDDVAVVTSWWVESPRQEPSGGSAVDSGAVAGEELWDWGPRRLQGFFLEKGGTLPHVLVELSSRPDVSTSSMGFTSANVQAETSINTPAGAASGEGTTHTVQIIGVLEDDETLAEGSMQMNRRVLDILNGEPVRPNAFYAKVAEGESVGETALALERAMLSSGLNATPLSELFAAGQAILRGILGLFQGFLALGLVVGIAGLGVISSRTVVERRQQIGVLRAIGYPSGTVALLFVLEANFIALTGILLGGITGLILGDKTIGQAYDLATQLSFPTPWLTIAGMLAAAWLVSLLTTILPAWQASRIYPAEALRYE